MSHGSAEPFAEPFEDEPSGAPAVRGFLHRPAASMGDALILTHGAGSSCHSPILLAVAAALAGGGLVVLRCDLPFRQDRPSGPPPAAAGPRDREGLRSAVRAVRRIAPGRVFLGGHSYGGRQASMLAADDVELAAGLLLLSYPLHPPRRPSEPRTAHFPRLRVRALFVHGSRDPFGSLEEMRAALTLIPARTSLVAVEGAGHDLSRRPRAPGAVVDVAAEAAAAFLALVG